MYWLTISGISREFIFCNVFKALKSFMVIPMTIPFPVHVYERLFSKLSIVKTKLRNAILQEHLGNILTMFIKQ